MKFNRDERNTMITSELYRNAEGHEVWRIARDGIVIVDDIASDHDHAWLVNELSAGPGWEV